MTSASLLIVILVGLVVGALTGMVLGGGIGGTVLAIVAGFLACLAAIAARYFIVKRGIGVGRDDSQTPSLVIFYALVASLAGSLAAKEVADCAELAAPGGIGALAGIFSSVLLAMLLIIYHTRPGDKPLLMKG